MTKLKVCLLCVILIMSCLLFVGCKQEEEFIDYGTSTVFVHISVPEKYSDIANVQVELKSPKGSIFATAAVSSFERMDDQRVYQYLMTVPAQDLGSSCVISIKFIDAEGNLIKQINRNSTYMLINRVLELPVTITTDEMDSIKAPRFSMEAGTYHNDIEVRILPSQDGVSTIYSLNRQPSRVYLNDTIYLSTTTEISAYSTTDGEVKSEKANALFRFKAGLPTASVPSGAFMDSVEVQFSTETEGAYIIYTTDGSVPTVSNGTVVPVDDTILVDQCTDFSLVAVRSGYLDSDVQYMRYDIQTLAPELSVQGGSYDEYQYVTIEAQNDADRIFCLPITSEIIREIEEELADDPEYFEELGITSIEQLWDLLESEFLYMIAEEAEEYDGSIIPVFEDTVFFAFTDREGCIPSQIVRTDYRIASGASSVSPEIPQFSVQAGTYTGDVEVELSSNGLVFYTTDGTEPTVESTLYTAPFVVDRSCTVRAVTLYGSRMSDVVDVRYDIVCPTPVPVLPEPDASGCYLEGAILELESDYDVYYTTDGSDPRTSSTAVLYEAPIILDRIMPFKAVARSPYASDSVVLDTYFRVRALPPVFVAPENEHVGSLDIKVKTQSSGSRIYLYYDGFPVFGHDGSCDYTVRHSGTYSAYVSKVGLEDSEKVSVDYTIISPIPTLSLGSGIYDGGQSVKVSLGMPDNSGIAYYTTDGSMPNAGSPSVMDGDSIWISKDTILTVRGCATGCELSPAVVSEYGVRTMHPYFSVESGRKDSSFYVTIGCMDEDALIYYTTDGTIPSENSIRYNGEEIYISSSTSLKAVSKMPGMSLSRVIEADYSFDLDTQEGSISVPTLRTLELACGNWDKDSAGIMHPGSDLTLTAKLLPESEDVVYTWYLDKELAKVNNGLYAWNSKYFYAGTGDFNVNLPVGIHTITVVADTGDNIYSQSIIYRLDYARRGYNSDYVANGESILGMRGPARGYIIYDCDADNNFGNADGLNSFECGWRFIEAADCDLTGTFSYSTAVSRCESLTYNGVSEWMLPSLEELSMIYSVMRVNGLGDVTGASYWSSDVYDSDNAWTFDMYCGESSVHGTAETCRIRPIRMF